MARQSALVSGVVTLGLASALAAQGGQYAKVGEIHIGGTVTRFDYLNIDTAAKRLYVANNTSVVVIDPRRTPSWGASPPA